MGAPTAKWQSSRQGQETIVDLSHPNPPAEVSTPPKKAESPEEGSDGILSSLDDGTFDEEIPAEEASTNTAEDDDDDLMLEGLEDDDDDDEIEDNDMADDEDSSDD
jgi:hypothetical protein